MRKIARLAIIASVVLGGLGLTASGAAAATPSVSAQSATVEVAAVQPAAAQQVAAAGWFYYASYYDLNTCNYAGFVIVANGWAQGSTCYARAGVYDLYLLY